MNKGRRDKESENGLLKKHFWSWSNAFKTYRNMCFIIIPLFSVDKQRLFLGTDALCHHQVRNKKYWFSDCSLSMPNFYNVAIDNLKNIAMILWGIISQSEYFSSFNNVHVNLNINYFNYIKVLSQKLIIVFLIFSF